MGGVSKITHRHTLKFLKEKKKTWPGINSIIHTQIHTKPPDGWPVVATGLWIPGAGSCMWWFSVVLGKTSNKHTAHNYIAEDRAGSIKYIYNTHWHTPTTTLRWSVVAENAHRRLWWWLLWVFSAKKERKEEDVGVYLNGLQRRDHHISLPLHPSIFLLLRYEPPAAPLTFPVPRSVCLYD